MKTSCCSASNLISTDILKVCKFCSESPLACLSGITGADLKKRVMQIMTARVPRKLNFGIKILLLAVGMFIVALCQSCWVRAIAAQRDDAHGSRVSSDAVSIGGSSTMLAELATPSKGFIAEAQTEAAPLAYEVVPGAAPNQVRHVVNDWAPSPEATMMPTGSVPPHGIRMIAMQPPEAPIELGSVGFSTEDWFNGGRILSKNDREVFNYRIGWAYVLPNGLEFHQGEFEIPGDEPEPRGTVRVPAQHVIDISRRRRTFIYFIESASLSDRTRWQADHKQIEAYYNAHYANGANTPAQTNTDPAAGV